MRKLEFKLDMREPYMGNTLPLRIIVMPDEKPPKLVMFTHDGMYHSAQTMKETTYESTE